MHFSHLPNLQSSPLSHHISTFHINVFSPKTQCGWNKSVHWHKSDFFLLSVRLHHFITLVGADTQKFSHIVLSLPRSNETSEILKKLQVHEVWHKRLACPYVQRSKMGRKLTHGFIILIEQNRKTRTWLIYLGLVGFFWETYIKTRLREVWEIHINFLSWSVVDL